MTKRNNDRLGNLTKDDINFPKWLTPEIVHTALYIHNAQTKEEAKRHDAIFLNELGATIEDKELGYGSSKLWDKVRADLDWFRQHNAEAYMVLLD